MATKFTAAIVIDITSETKGFITSLLHIFRVSKKKTTKAF